MEKLDKLLEDLTIVKTDISYIKEYIETIKQVPVKLSVLESSFNLVRNVVFSVCGLIGIAVIGAVISLVV